MSSFASLSQSELPWWQAWLRHFYIRLISPKGLSTAIGAVLFVMLSVLLCSDYLMVLNLDPGGISSQDIYASFPMDVVDEAATRERINQFKGNLPLIYLPEEEIDQRIRNHVLERCRQLEQFDHSFHLQAGAKNIEHAKSQLLKVLGTQSISPVILNEFMNTNHRPFSPAFWNRVRVLCQVTIDKLLKQGVNTSDFFERKYSLVRQAIPDYEDSPIVRELTTAIVGSTLEPNRVLNEEAMSSARRQAEESVSPVIRTYRTGEKIIERGEVITTLQLSALKQMGKPVQGMNITSSFGVVLLCLIFIGTLWTTCFFFQKGTFFKPSYLAMLAFITFGHALLFKINLQHQNVFPLYAFPLAAYPLTIAVFVHPRIGILATTLLVFLLGLTTKSDFGPLSVLLFGSLVGIAILTRTMNVSERSQMMIAGVYVSISSVLMVTALHFINSTSLLGSQWNQLIPLYGWALLGGLLSAALTVGTLPYLESLFRLITPYSLMELGNHDKPLLKRMQFEAPGTFHHSLMVSSLAEAAAETIGANSLVARVGALYHDIGKLKRPLFFIENQAYFGVENPHDKLTPRLSKMVLTAHTRDGLELARMQRLPEVLSKFIVEHHGTMVTGYFYNKACEQEGTQQVNKSQFRYPGPKPTTKESAIVMLADACESAVRSLKAPTVVQIEERIAKITQQRIEDGQFDDCPITFKEINLIQETFLRVLRGIQHNRIEYQQMVITELGKRFPQLSSNATEAPLLALPPKNPKNGNEKNGKKSDLAPLQTSQDTLDKMKSDMMAELQTIQTEGTPPASDAP